MSEALEAISDIKQALSDYGTDVILRKIVKGAYDIDTGEESETITEYPMKAFLPSRASSNLLNNSEVVTSSSYDVIFQIYHDEDVTKDWQIEYNSHIFEIVLVDSKVLQNETLMFEIVCKR